MRPDQERVRNLLIDTVTLLCKNSLQFEQELHVEGLLGVSVDKKEVFFVHISKEFSNNPSDGASVTREKDNEEATPQSTVNKDNDKHIEDTSNHDRVRVKTESLDLEEDECSIVEDPSIKLEGVASPAQMVAGQRRGFKRSSHSHLAAASGDHYSGDDSNLSGGYSMQGEAGQDSSTYQMQGEPAAKRRLESPEDGGSYGGDEEQGWPNMASIQGFDPAQSQTFQDSDSQLGGGDSSQPGCSSWSIPGRGPSDSIEILVAAAENLKATTPLSLPNTTTNITTTHEKSSTSNPSPASLGKTSNDTTLPVPLSQLKLENPALPMSLSSLSPFSEKNPMSWFNPLHPVFLRTWIYRRPEDSRWQCLSCGDTFASKQNLQVHMRRHTGERPFTCMFCTKAFAQKSTLKRHLEVHRKMYLALSKNGPQCLGEEDEEEEEEGRLVHE